MRNILLSTDVYKMGHMEQYCPGTTKVYSYLTARSSKYFNEVVWFGLKYYLEEYLTKPIEPWMLSEFCYYRKNILGIETPLDVINKIQSLNDLGYWPLEIKALPEGKAYPLRVPLMTITNTHPDFYWCVGFVESLLLKLWFPCVVATHSREYRDVVERAYAETCSEEFMFLKDYAVHDFGYRGDSSEESACLSGAAHLLNFKGSDTVVAYPFVDRYYPGLNLEMHSVPASEHSVMCSFGKDHEFEAYEHMLNTYPTGIVSIVSDTYDIYNVLGNFAEKLKNRILMREGKVVFRPDSGDPIKIICGDPEALEGSLQWLGCLRILDNIFGSTINSKGFKEINPKVGLIYGDGMYLERYKNMLFQMKEMRYAASNLMIGVGGILRNHTRDDLGFAIKATYVEVNGERRDIMKDPITDHGKKSHCGFLSVNESFKVLEHCTADQEKEGLLKTVFINGSLTKEK